MALIYLVGPIGGQTWEQATGWRYLVASLLQPLDCRSPLRPMNGMDIAQSTHLDKSGLLQGQDDEKVPFSKLFDRDYGDVDAADALFINFIGATRKSIGSAMEISRGFKRGIPMVMAMEPGNINEDVFLEEHFKHPSQEMNCRCHTLKAAVNAMRAIFSLPAYDLGDN